MTTALYTFVVVSVTIVLAQVLISFLLPTNISSKNRAIQILIDYVLDPFRNSLIYLIKRSVGKLGSPVRESVSRPKYLNVRGIGCEEILVEFKPIEEDKRNWWRFHIIEVQVAENTGKSKTSELQWNFVSKSSEEDHLIDKLKSRTQYFVRSRIICSGFSGDWELWSIPTWTLSPRTLLGGSTGPLQGSTSEYSWWQDDAEVEIDMEIDDSLKRPDISCEIKKRSILLSFSNEVVLQGSFPKEVKFDESFWQINESKEKLKRRHLVISLAKSEKTQNWPFVIDGHPPIELF